MSNRLLPLIVLLVVSLCLPQTARAADADYRELDIATLQGLMERGELTSVVFTRFYR